jgi:hypothetical protein
MPVYQDEIQLRCPRKEPAICLTPSGRWRTQLAMPHIGCLSQGVYKTFYEDTVTNIRKWLDIHSSVSSSAKSAENTRWPRLKMHLVKTKQCRPSQCEPDGFCGISRNGIRAVVP